METHKEGAEAQATGPAEHALVIVGAGLAALCLAQRLPEALLRRTLVVDRAGAWLHSWSAKCARMDVRRVHCLNSQTPHRNASAFQAFYQHCLQTEAGQDSSPPSGPRVQDLLDFCNKEIISYLPDTAQAVCKAEVISVVPIAEEPEQGTCMVHLADGRRIKAGSVAYCSSHSIPVTPPWLLSLFDCDHEQLQRTSHLKEPTLGALIGYEGKVVAIMVDKGCSHAAAQMCLAALQMGAQHVLLVLQEELHASSLSLEVGWYGSKHMQAYRGQKDPRERLRSCRQAWEQRSIAPDSLHALESQVAEGKVTIIQLNTLLGIRILHTDSGTATALPLSRLDGLTQIQSSFAIAVDAAEADKLKCLNPQPITEEKQVEVVVDGIFTAAGPARDAMGDPVLRQLQQVCPTRVVGGYCVLDDETLAWPGLSMYLLGGCSSLALGPIAGEVAGMRTGADRLAGWLSLSFKGRRLPEVRPWQRIASALGESRGVVDADVPLDGYGPVPMLPVAKPSIFKPPGRIDISDLDPAFPRKEVLGYTWTDNGFQISIICPIPEAVPRQQVRILFTTQSLEMWAVGATTAFHIHIPKLYQPVVLERCTFKANSQRKKIYLLLHKRADAEWRFLKG